MDDKVLKHIHWCKAFCRENHKHEGIITTDNNANYDVKCRIISNPPSNITSINPSNTISIAQSVKATKNLPKI